MFLIVSPNNGDTSLSDSTIQSGMLYFFANPLAREVFPVPGGPYSRTVKFGVNFEFFNFSVNSSNFIKALKKSSKISFLTSFPIISSTDSFISEDK